MTEAIQPPRYVFALFGRRQSGKSVYLAALRATRRPQVNGFGIRYIGSLAPIRSDGIELKDESERKRIENAFMLASDALSDGRVPPATNTSDGIMGHRFEITLPEPPAPAASVRIHVDIYDYAGEFLALENDDPAAEQHLHEILRETDGLLILAETPARDIDAAAHRSSLNGVTALGEALARLGAKDPQAIGLAVLLATKWDHQHIFACNRSDQEPMNSYLHRLAEEESRHETLFREWLATSPAAEQHHLLDRDLRSIFRDGNYRALPVSAFGESKLVDIGAADGSKAEVPARVPLASLNLDEPLIFLVERARSRQRAALLKFADQPVQDIGRLPEPAEIIAAHGEDAELLAIRDTLATRLAELAARQSEQASSARIRKRSRLIGRSALLMVAAAVGVIAWDATRTFGFESDVRKDVSTALDLNNLESVINARNRLDALALHKPLLPVLQVLAQDYSLTDRQADRTQLIKAECALWADSVRRTDFDPVRGSERLKSLQDCVALDEALAKARLNDWQSEVRDEMNAFRRLTEPANCAHPEFTINAITDQRAKLHAVLDRTPSGAEKYKAATADEIAGLAKVCMTAYGEAQEQRADAALAEQAQQRIVELRNARESELRKLDQDVRGRQDWSAYLKGLVVFMNKDGAVPPEDQQIRREEVAKRLRVLPAELENWRQVLNQSRSNDESFDPSRNAGLVSLKAEVSGLPDEFQEQKVALIGKIAEIENNLAIWNACDKFSSVLNTYDELSRRISARSEHNIESLKNAIARLRNDQAVRDHVMDGLDAIEGQLDQVSTVIVESIQIKGRMIKTESITWKWYVGGHNSAPSRPIGVEDDRFELTIRPRVKIGGDDVDMFISALQNVNWSFDVGHFALKMKISKDTLLGSEVASGSNMNMEKTLDKKLYQFREPVTSGAFSEKNAFANRSVNLTYTLTAEPGAKIRAQKCQ